MPPLGFAFGDLHGTASDEQIVESNVLQHKSALASAITLGDLGGRSAADLNAGVLADARVPASNVTQHQGALTLTKSQISDFGGPYLPLSGGVLTGRVTGSAGLYVKNSVIAAGGQSAGDLTLLGNIYDRNCLAICDKRGGSITASFTGAGSGNSLSLLVNGNNDFGYILGTDNTTTQFQIVCDVGELQGNYGNAYWHPFVQYRLTPSNPATYYNSIVVEIAADSEGPWYKPPGGQWETSDYANNQSAEALWIGADAVPTGLPLYQWRYCRFTFSDRIEDAGYGSKASVWIQQIGLRHKFEPFSRSLFRADGGTIYGDTEITGKLTVSDLDLSGLPTSDPAVAGKPWNNAGVVTVSAG
ncbi:hypothetical protein GYB59_02080 [bacterium]|nr:hypothetical protein [bacterium]